MPLQIWLTGSTLWHPGENTRQYEKQIKSFLSFTLPFLSPTGPCFLLKHTSSFSRGHIPKITEA